MKPIFKIDGVDFSWILNEESIVWSRNDIDSENTKRSTLTGDMRRKRLAVKRKLGIKNCKDMTTDEIKSLNAALYPELISVEVLDPIVGGARKATFYGSSVETTTQVYDPVADETYWVNTSFSLIEK